MKHAEGVGFEPTRRCRQHAFQACALGRTERSLPSDGSVEAPQTGAVEHLFLEHQLPLPSGWGPETGDFLPRAPRPRIAAIDASRIAGSSQEPLRRPGSVV